MVPELLLSGIVYQITYLYTFGGSVMHSRIDLNTRLIKMLFDYKSDLTETGGLATGLRLILCYLRCGQRGFPALVASHWIGFDCSRKIGENNGVPLQDFLAMGSDINHWGGWMSPLNLEWRTLIQNPPPPDFVMMQDLKYQIACITMQ